MAEVDVMAKSAFALIFLMILTLGVSLGLPTEDVLDTVYDESESQPLGANAQVSIAEEQRGGEPQAARKRVSGCRFQSHQTNSPKLSAKDSLIILDHSLRC